MRALTLRQPWAWLTLHGKNPENRRWKTRFRGYFLIHAGQTMTVGDYFDAFRMVGALKGVRPLLPLQEEFRRAALGPDLSLGGIVGVAKLVDVLPRLPHGVGPVPDWRLEGQYGFQLAHVAPVPFIPCPGARQFWRVPERVADALVGQVSATVWLQLQQADERYSEAKVVVVK